jgi:alpha-ketoglutarate-dependent taurine dioxygenase
MSFEIIPSSSSIGAEVRGLDLSTPPSEQAILRLNDAWIRFKVLILIDQKINDEQQIEFTRRFGVLEEFPLQSARNTEHREIFRVSNVSPENTVLASDDNRVRYLKVTQAWHIDSSYRDVPSKGSVFRGIEVTRHGGETWFSDLEQAYIDLPADLKAIVDTHCAVHDFEVSRRAVGNLVPLSKEERAAVPPVKHPLRRFHPVTGRLSVFLSPVHTSHIEGMEKKESQRVLDALAEFCTQEKYLYKHRWWPNDLMMWDNRCIMHYAQPYDSQRSRRVMHRTTLAGAVTL